MGFSSQVCLCALCGGGGVLRERFDLGEYAIGQCARCGVLQQMPMPSRDQLEASYRNPNYAEDTYFTSTAVADAEIAVHQWGLDALARLGEEDGRLLDIGCGNGRFILEAQARGWQCDGVELSPALANQAREKTGAAIATTAFEELDVPDQTFDAVAMWDVLEHLPDPRPVLHKAKRILTQRGLLLVFTPDYGHSLLALLARASYHLTGGKVRGPMRSVYGRYHVVYHTRASVQRLFEETGFRLERVKFFASGGERHAISNRLVRRGVGFLDTAAKLLRREYRMLAVGVSRFNARQK